MIRLTRMPAFLRVLLSIFLLNPMSAARAGEADPSNFFRKLESIDLDTRQIRKVADKIEIFFSDSSDESEAS